MNLIWLQYVSYVLCAAAAIFYFRARLVQSGLARPIQFAATFLCLFLAALLWEFQERNAYLNSPRSTVTGKVIFVTQNGHKSGTFDDDFELQSVDGIHPPRFNTGNILSETQPLHIDDVVRVTYRTWDSQATEIVELGGVRPGWHNRRFSPSWSMTYVSATIFLLSLGWLIKEYRRTLRGEKLIYPSQSDKREQSEIQQLGL